MLAGIARGRSYVRHPLESGDAHATMACLERLGVAFERNEDGIFITPPMNWTQPGSALDCGNSGTTMRLISGLIASRPLDCTLVGDESLSRRPMRRIADPLRQMGASVEGDTPPLRIQGGDLRGIRYATPVASAQIKSCILLAGLKAEGETWVTEPRPSRNHTEVLLRHLGAPIREEGGAVGVAGGGRLNSFSLTVPGDISSAAFFLCAAAMIPGSRIDCFGCGVNPTRDGLLDVFTQSQVEWIADGPSFWGGEPVADLSVCFSPDLRAFEIEGDLVPRLIDEIPILAVLATQANGVSSIRDAKELRVKESDRIEIMAEGLRRMGATVEAYDDGLEIEGPVDLVGTTIDAHGDHRIAMAFAVAGLIADGKTTITGEQTIQTSYPGFEEELNRLAVW